LAKGPGFVIPIVIAAFFGAGSLTDAYFLAYGGVLLVGGAVAQPLEAVVVPFAAHALALGQRASATFSRELALRGVTLGLASVVGGAILIVLGITITRPDVSRMQVVDFYAILAPGAVAWCVASLYSGALISAWRLEMVALAYGFRGLGALAGALAGAVIHEMWPVALGVSTGEWVRVWWVRRLWKRAIGALPEGTGGSPQHGLVAAAGHQMGAQGLVAGVQFLERFLAGTVAVAAITHVEYSMRLVMVASVLFDGGVAPWPAALPRPRRISGWPDS